MSCSKWIVALLAGMLFAGMAQATLIIDEQFNYADGSNIGDVSSWVVSSGGTVNGGVLSAGGTVTLDLGETYAIDPAETSADNNVTDLWFRYTIRIPAGGSAAVGVGSSDQTSNLGYYASAASGMNSEAEGGLLSGFVAWNQQRFVKSDPVPVYDGTEFVEIYGHLYDLYGSFRVEIWFNPSDPENLGTANAANSRDYSLDTSLMDRLEMKMGGGVYTEFDSVMLGTELADVIPEPATVSLFTVSGLSCFLLRKLY